MNEVAIRKLKKPYVVVLHNPYSVVSAGGPSTRDVVVVGLTPPPVYGVTRDGGTVHLYPGHIADIDRQEE